MKTKTIRYDENHRINGDTLERFTRIAVGEVDYENDKQLTDDKWDYLPTKIKIGAELTLVSSKDVSPNNLRYGENSPSYWLHDGPIAGNLAPNITRYHGWRGTTSNISVHAHGVHRVLKMRTLKNTQIAVTVGPDLHPDWD